MATGFLLGLGWRWGQFLAEKLLTAHLLNLEFRLPYRSWLFNNLFHGIDFSLQTKGYLLKIGRSYYGGLTWIVKISRTQKT